MVISKSIATDLYDGRELARFFSTLSAVQGLVPICAPVLGGVLLEVTDWRGIFDVLLFLGVALVGMLCFFRESLPSEYRHGKSLLSVFRSYRPVVTHRDFMFYVLVQAFAMGVMFAYIAASPFIFQQHFGLSSLAYSVCFGVNALSVMVGSFVVCRFGSVRRGLGMGSVAFSLMCLVTGMLLVSGGGVVWVEGALLVLLLCLGMILPTSTTLALELERGNSGSASAVLGFMPFLFGGVVSPLAGLGDMVVSLATVIAVCGLCTLFFCRGKLRTAEVGPRIPPSREPDVNVCGDGGRSSCSLLCQYPGDSLGHSFVRCCEMVARVHFEVGRDAHFPHEVMDGACASLYLAHERMACAAFFVSQREIDAVGTACRTVVCQVVDEMRIPQ